MVIRPYGYAIWEFHSAGAGPRIQGTGHVNALLPSSFRKGADQERSKLKGSRHKWRTSPNAGGEEYEEAVVGPTSERSSAACTPSGSSRGADLRILINQWANVVRWEKVTRPVPADHRVPVAERDTPPTKRMPRPKRNAEESWTL
jgi:prolyl-tRNA synthetase